MGLNRCNSNVSSTAATPENATSCKFIITDKVFPAWGATALYMIKRQKGLTYSDDEETTSSRIVDQELPVAQLDQPCLDAGL